MNPTFKRGFTLIELLVVIAIIGILAGIVLAALGSTRDKAKNAGAQANLHSLRTQAEVYASANANNYTGLCATAQATNILNAAIKASGATPPVNIAIGTAGSADTVTCHDGAAAWAAEAPMVTSPDNMWCVDSTGRAGTTTVANALIANDLTCN